MLLFLLGLGRANLPHFNDNDVDLFRSHSSNHLFIPQAFTEGLFWRRSCCTCWETRTRTTVNMPAEWRQQWQPTPGLSPGRPHGRRSLVGCSPWGRKESHTTEQLHFPFSLSCTGEGNGKPLQCSCLENPRDRGAWWAAVYGATQSQTRLKWLNSSSNGAYVPRDRQYTIYTEIHILQSENYKEKYRTGMVPG